MNDIEWIIAITLLLSMLVPTMFLITSKLIAADERAHYDPYRPTHEPRYPNQRPYGPTH